VTTRTLAIDVGGTKTDIAWVSDTGEITTIARIDTVAAGLRLFEEIVSAVPRSELSSHGLIGVGCGGPMSRGGELVSPLNIPAWRDFPLRAALTEHFGCEVTVENDAKALALAEGRFGAARDAANYVSMVVSTGVGGGVVIDGRLLDGATGNAGHIGHIVVNPGGALCECGVQGCLEAEASGTAIARLTGRPASEAEASVRRRTGDMVGRAVATTASLLDVRNFYIAGSVALGYGAEFFESANAAARKNAGLSFTADIQVLPSGLDDRGPILGAACVAWRSLKA
jgi:glucokinase